MEDQMKKNAERLGFSLGFRVRDLGFRIQGVGI